MRALVHGWRHTRSSLVGIDIIEAADIVAEGSLRSSSIMPEDPAQPGHRQRVGGQSRLSRPHVYTILQCAPQTTPDASGPVARTARPKTKVPRATYLASPTALPMAPKPAYDLNKHMCQRAGPAGRVDGRPARLCGRSRPSCRHSRMEAVGDATRLGPSEPRRASRKLPTRSAHEERKPGRLPREGWLHRARWASSLTPVAARASTGCRDKQSTCPTCARTPLSHRRTPDPKRCSVEVKSCFFTPQQLVNH